METYVAIIYKLKIRDGPSIRVRGYPHWPMRILHINYIINLKGKNR